MSKATSKGGLKMALLIRLCPLPWQVSSSVLSFCDSVSYKTYCLATLFAPLKTSLEVWIGSQLAALTNATLPPEARKVAMITVDIWVYRLTIGKVKEMQGRIYVDNEDQMAFLNYEEEDNNEL